MIPTRRNLVVNGVRCLLREVGDPTAKEAVVLVHGNPGAGADFDGLLPAIGALSRAVAPDLPGYGESDRPRDFPYTIEGYADYLAALLDELGIEQAHLVLHDFGGAFGLALAIKRIERIKSFVLLGIGVLPGYEWHKYARIWRTPLLGELFSLTTMRWSFRLSLNADNPKPLPDAFIDRMYDQADWGLKRGVLALYRSANNPGAFADLVGPVLAAARRPALVVWGADDPYVPARYAPLQTSYFDAEVHVLDRAGHWPMIDEPDLVRTLVVAFLERQLAG